MKFISQFSQFKHNAYPACANEAYPSTQRPRLAGLDIVRTIAIVLVLISHLPPWLGALIEIPQIYLLNIGFHAVELFFVLSGLLIGKILFDVFKTKPNTKSILLFWTRRWMRTLPLYYITLLAFLFFLPSKEANPLGYIFFSQNLFWRMPADNWFGNSWSLAHEEWFYISLPFLSFCIFKFFKCNPIKALIISCAAILVLCPLMRGTSYLMHPNLEDWDSGFRKVAYFRMDAFVVGILGSWLAQRVKPFDAKLNVILLLVANIISVWALNSYLSNHQADFFFKTFFFDITDLVCLGWCLFFYTVQRGGRIFRWLSDHTYSLYLFHYLLIWIIWDESSLVGPVQKSIAYIVTLLVASTLFEKFIERPIIDLRPRQR